MAVLSLVFDAINTAAASQLSAARQQRNRVTESSAVEPLEVTCEVGR